MHVTIPLPSSITLTDWSDTFETEGEDDNSKRNLYLGGQLVIAGASHHLMALRVTTAKERCDRMGEALGGGSPDEQVSYDDSETANSLMNDVISLYDASTFETVTLPGVEGDFILWMHPYED